MKDLLEGGLQNAIYTSLSFHHHKSSRECPENVTFAAISYHGPYRRLCPSIDPALHTTFQNRSALDGRNLLRYHIIVLKAHVQVPT